MNIEIGQKFYTADGIPHIVLNVEGDKITASGSFGEFGEDYMCAYTGLETFSPADVVCVVKNVGYGFFDERFEEVRNRLVQNGYAYLYNVECWGLIYKSLVKGFDRRFEPAADYAGTYVKIIDDTVEKGCRKVDFDEAYRLISNNEKVVLDTYKSFLNWVKTKRELNEFEKKMCERHDLRYLLYKDGECVGVVQHVWQPEFAFCIPYVVC